MILYSKKQSSQTLLQ